MPGSGTDAAQQSLRLSGVAWATYSRLLTAFEGCPGTRLTYDRGELEIMLPSFRHDRRAHFLNRLICTLTEEAGLPIIGGRSTTLRRRRKRRGLEPDDCYWIQSAARVANRDRINLDVDPPPDLAVEVNETSSSLNRIAIYDTLQIPELWRVIEGVLGFFGRSPDAGYSAIERSLAFPWLSAADLAPFIEEGMRTDNENAVIKQFREWVREALPRE